MESFDTYSGFWGNLKKPIIGLSPMDGVTDFACRYITAKYAKPDVMFTEFTTVEGLFHAPEKILRDFEYSEIERPIVAQIYGATPDDFYKTAHVVCELGFDGVDINMGCPSKAVVKRNCGAKLITVPDLAIEIIKAVRQGVHDWAKGQTLEDLKLPQNFLDIIYQMNLRRCGVAKPAMKKIIPYSVKTRIGYDSDVVEWWMERLLAEKPAAISIHGRTLKQMYQGKANWDAIARAAKIIHQTKTLVLGNGDIASVAEAKTRIEESGVDGALIGRHAIGNPWVFNGHTARREEKIAVALEHAIYYSGIRKATRWSALGKHLVGYMSHFPDASQLRQKMFKTPSLESLIALLRQFEAEQGLSDSHEPTEPANGSSQNRPLP